MLLYLSYPLVVTLRASWSDFQKNGQTKTLSLREWVEGLVVKLIDISWLLVNSVSKYELWNGQRKFVGLANKLARVEMQIQSVVRVHTSIVKVSCS